jgi:hypothetical protein
MAITSLIPPKYAIASSYSSLESGSLEYSSTFREPKPAGFLPESASDLVIRELINIQRADLIRIRFP